MSPRDIDLDEQEEQGLYRNQRAYERALSARDPFYPPELHEQDVRGRFERFRWSHDGSITAAATLVAGRVKNKKMGIDEALSITIPKYSHNHDDIPVWELEKVRKLAEHIIENWTEEKTQ